MKKQISLICLLIFACSISWAADNYPIEDIEEGLKENANTIIRYQSIEFKVIDKGHAKEKRKIVATIMNKKSNYDVMPVFYGDFTSVKYIKGSILNKEGKIVDKIRRRETMDFSAASDYSLHEDSRVEVLDGSYDQYPYTVIYEYEVIHNGIMDYPDFYVVNQYETAVEKTEYSLTLPMGLGIHFKNQNIDASPIIEKADDEQQYKWTLKNIPAIVKEPFSPEKWTIFPVVKIVPDEISVSGYEGNLSDWKNYGMFQYQLNKDHNNLSEETKSKIKELTKDAETVEEKIDIVYDYLQANTRYVSVQLGIGGWQSFDAQYVENNNYGDCKALTYFTKSMLESLDIESFPVLIKRDSDHPNRLSDDFSESAFNHVLLFVPKTENNDSLWLECTSSYNPINYIGSSNQNRDALLLLPDGGKIIKTPEKNHNNNIRTQHTIVNLDEKGAAAAKVNRRMFNEQQEYFRYMYHEVSKDDQIKTFQEYLELPTFTMDNYKLTVNDKAPEAHLSYDVNIPRYASNMGKRLFLKPNFISRKSEIPEEVKSKKLPFENTLGYTLIDTVTYQIPEGFVIESLPKNEINIQNTFGHYDVKITSQDQTITYIRKLSMFEFYEEGEKYDSYRNFIKEIVKADNMKIVLVKNE